jgi:hypothetical protein
MKLWHKTIIALVIIALIIAGALWWIPFHELSKGQLAIIGYSNSGPSLYLLNPLFRSWSRLQTDNLFPWRMAWSPNGEKIAFTYSTSNDNEADVVGVAILDLEKMETQEVYIAPSNEGLNVVTWTLDGHSLVFDVYENNVLTAFRNLDIVTGKLQSIPFPQSIQPQYFSVNHLEVAQNNDYVIGGLDGIYIAPPNLGNLNPVTEIGDIDGFFLTSDRKEITTPCAQSTLCNYSIDTNKLTKTYRGVLPDYGTFFAGNWSYDEKDVVYLSGGGGEGDPQYIVLVDTQNQQNYTIYKFQDEIIGLGPTGVSQLAWYSEK